MKAAVRIAALSLIFSACTAGAFAQSAAKDQAISMRDQITAETGKGFAEFELAQTAENTQDGVCPHLANGVEHFIAANQISNTLIQYLADNRLWDAEQAAEAFGKSVATTANGAIDIYRKSCGDWVDTRRK
ncbi:MAG: hypothetical protein GC145_18390 [Caulobacter sp.]|nr:hypothetical protein [Caulobacter sp.]